MGKDEARIHLRALNTLTRLRVACTGLGIDAARFASRTTELVPMLDRYARVWLDADFKRVALRTFAQSPELKRPGVAYVELETIPGMPLLVETALVVGIHPLDDDLRALVDARVERAVVDDLGGKLRGLGTQATDLFGRRTIPGDTHWLVGVNVGTGTVGPVSQLAGALGASDFQLAMLAHVHDELAQAGCLVTLACTSGTIRELAIEYRDVAWPHVIGLTDKMLSIQSARPYGAFAGAFNLDSAARVELMLRPAQAARIRVAAELSEVS